MAALYECKDCGSEVAPDWSGFARELAGLVNADSGGRWWHPGTQTWTALRVEMVAHLWRQPGPVCGRHCNLLSAMTIHLMQGMCFSEAGVFPGSVTRRERDLGDGPYEQAGRIRHLEAMVGQVRRVTEGDSRIGAMVDVDVRMLRLRTTITVVDDEGAWTALVPMDHIGGTYDLARVVRAGG